MSNEQQEPMELDADQLEQAAGGVFTEVNKLQAAVKLRYQGDGFSITTNPAPGGGSPGSDIPDLR